MYVGKKETNVSRLKYEYMNITKNAVLGRTYNIRSNLRDRDRQVKKIGKLILKKRREFAVLHSWN